MQQLSQDQQQQQMQRFYRQELQELAHTRDSLRAQHRPRAAGSDSDYDSLSDRNDDEDGIQAEAADMQTHIPSSNVGYKLLLKMGWKAGTGLGQNATGRTAPIPIERKQDVLGIGKQEVDTWYNESSTAKRRTLEVERQAEETEEERNKREQHVQQKMAVQAELEAVKAAFYCALCDKQYERISDYEVHLSSYDHNHKKRFKEMKETSRAGAASTTNKLKEKERRREERELAKLQEAAMKRAGGSGRDTAATTTGMHHLSTQSSSRTSGFQPVQSSGFQPVNMTTESSRGTMHAMEGVTAASSGTKVAVGSGFQSMKMGGFQPVKVSGFQPIKVIGFQSVEDDDMATSETTEASGTHFGTGAGAGAGAGAVPALAPSGFQPVKLGGFKPMKIGGFQLKKPGGK